MCNTTNSDCSSALAVGIRLGLLSTFHMTAYSDTIPVVLQLSDQVGKNVFDVSITGLVPPGLSDIAMARGTVEIELTAEFDPLTYQPIAVTGVRATGGSWLINDLLFQSSIPYDPTQYRTIGVGGTLGSFQTSTITDGVFPAMDHFVTFCQGSVDSWSEVEPGIWEWIKMYDFSLSPFLAPISSGSGTLSVTLASVVGDMANYDVTGTLAVQTSMMVGFFAFLDVTGVGEARGIIERGIPAPCLADFNNDWNIDGDDLNSWKAGFGIQNGAQKVDGDADGDGDVDGNDFLIWQRQYGDSCPLSLTSIPEPSTLILFLLFFFCGLALVHCYMSLSY